MKVNYVTITDTIYGTVCCTICHTICSSYLWHKLWHKLWPIIWQTKDISRTQRCLAQCAAQSMLGSIATSGTICYNLRRNLWYKSVWQYLATWSGVESTAAEFMQNLCIGQLVSSIVVYCILLHILCCETVVTMVMLLVTMWTLD